MTFRFETANERWNYFCKGSANWSEQAVIAGSQWMEQNSELADDVFYDNSPGTERLHQAAAAYVEDMANYDPDGLDAAPAEKIDHWNEFYGDEANNVSVAQMIAYDQFMAGAFKKSNEIVDAAAHEWEPLGATKAAIKKRFQEGASMEEVKQEFAKFIAENNLSDNDLYEIGLEEPYQG